MSQESEDKHTCPLYIAFCSGLEGQHTKGADGSRYQSIYVYEPTEPSQPVMSDGVSEDRPQHRKLHPLVFSNSMWVLLTLHRVILISTIHNNQKTSLNYLLTENEVFMGKPQTGTLLY